MAGTVTTKQSCDISGIRNASRYVCVHSKSATELFFVTESFIILYFYTYK